MSKLKTISIRLDEQIVRGVFKQVIQASPHPNLAGYQVKFVDDNKRTSNASLGETVLDRASWLIGKYKYSCIFYVNRKWLFGHTNNPLFNPIPKNVDELGFIIGHEYKHCQHNIQERSMHKGSLEKSEEQRYQEEIEADEEGLNMAAHACYNPKSALSWIRPAIDEYEKGITEDKKNHPLNAVERANRDWRTLDPTHPNPLLRGQLLQKSLPKTLSVYQTCLTKKQ